MSNRRGGRPRPHQSWRRLRHRRGVGNRATCPFALWSLLAPKLEAFGAKAGYCIYNSMFERRRTSSRVDRVTSKTPSAGEPQSICRTVPRPSYDIAYSKPQRTPGPLQEGTGGRRLFVTPDARSRPRRSCRQGKNNKEPKLRSNKEPKLRSPRRLLRHDPRLLRVRHTRTSFTIAWWWWRRYRSRNTVVRVGVRRDPLGLVGVLDVLFRRPDF